MSKMEDSPNLCVGDWIRVHGVPFQITKFSLDVNDIPKLELKHPIEMCEEMNFNEVTYNIGTGLMIHTYSNKCPEGCHGQLEDCKLKDL